MDIKEEEEYEENEGKDEIRNKILRIMGQVKIFLMKYYFIQTMYCIVPNLLETYDLYSLTKEKM